MKILFSFLVVISIALSIQAKSTVSSDSLIINTPEKTDENIKQQNQIYFQPKLPISAISAPIFRVESEPVPNILEWRI